MTTARAIFAAVVAAFARPQLNDSIGAHATHERVAEQDGLVGEHTAFRVRTAFERFSRSLFGGGR